mmetsp:Transcript_2402/g.7370  ORF Transcript_2402/g.7370 Transcript_2402/m.7370 type:complete len:109 (+) Transcript_2402:2025-2351(+)
MYSSSGCEHSDMFNEKCSSLPLPKMTRTGVSMRRVLSALTTPGNAHENTANINNILVGFVEDVNADADADADALRDQKEFEIPEPVDMDDERKSDDIGDQDEDEEYEP